MTPSTLKQRLTRPRKPSKPELLRNMPALRARNKQTPLTQRQPRPARKRRTKVTWWAVGMTALNVGTQVLDQQKSKKAAKADAEFEAQQLEASAGRDRAAGQRRAADERRQARLVESALQARSGGDVVPGIVKLQSDIAGEGEYRALTALYGSTSPRNRRAARRPQRQRIAALAVPAGRRPLPVCGDHLGGLQQPLHQVRGSEAAAQR